MPSDFQYYVSPALHYISYIGSLYRFVEITADYIKIDWRASAAADFGGITERFCVVDPK